MKPISEMTLLEIADFIEYEEMPISADRLRAIHDLTRWIPVDERLPTESDALNGEVEWLDNTRDHYKANPDLWNVSSPHIFYTHWRRIARP
jgi:hypothetical protein